MKLVYYRKDVPNFGDDLNVALWPTLAPDLFAEGGDDAFFGIGTIVGMKADARRIHVFSSGAGYDPPDAWRGRDVTWWCVRGPFSAHVAGIPAERAMTDGAVLTPLASGFPREAGRKTGTIVVPHWESLAFPGWEEAARLSGFVLVDPRGTPEAVIAHIASAALVLTESLHGAILADTYGVPWLAFASSKNFAVHKWVDWTRSLGRDLDISAVPPPDAGGLFAFGRWPERGMRRFGMDDALSGFRARMAEASAVSVAGPRGPKALARAFLKRNAWTHRFLGYSPARTAEALTALARRDPIVSAPSLIGSLQDRMMSRLRELARSQGVR